MPKSRGKNKRFCLNACAVLAALLIGSTTGPVTAPNGAHGVCAQISIEKEAIN